MTPAQHEGASPPQSLGAAMLKYAGLLLLAALPLALLWNNSSWVGILAPGGTPPQIVAALNAYIVKGMNSPGAIDKLAADGTAVIVSTPQEFQARIKSELARWAKVVKQSGIKPE